MKGGGAVDNNKVSKRNSHIRHQWQNLNGVLISRELPHQKVFWKLIHISEERF